MKVVELYGRVRYAVQIEGLSRREAARQFGIDPRTVAKMLAFSVPPGYRRSRHALEDPRARASLRVSRTSASGRIRYSAIARCNANVIAPGTLPVPVQLNIRRW